MGQTMKTNSTVMKIAQTALFAALCYVIFTYLQIKIPMPGGDATSIHLGNAFCVLAALLLGGWYGGLAGAIGMGIGDLLDPVYVTYAPKTIILKLMIGIVTGLVAHKIFKIEKHDNDSHLIIFNVVGEPIFGYFYNSMILGAPEKAAATLASWNAITTSVNAVITVALASTIYLVIRPRLAGSGILVKLAPHK